MKPAAAWAMPGKEKPARMGGNQLSDFIEKPLAE
jgi:hypothetical protein